MVCIRDCLRTAIYIACEKESNVVATTDRRGIIDVQMRESRKIVGGLMTVTLHCRSIAPESWGRMYILGSVCGGV